MLYPSISERVNNLLNAAQNYAISAPQGFSDWFSLEIDAVNNDKEKFLLELADTARSSVIDTLIDKANEIAIEASIPNRNEKAMQRVLDAFELMTPAADIGDLTNILNAAWQAYHDDTLWDGIPIDRLATLNELVLKSIEILEFEERIKADDP